MADLLPGAKIHVHEEKRGLDFTGTVLRYLSDGTVWVDSESGQTYLVSLDDVTPL